MADESIKRDFLFALASVRGVGKAKIRKFADGVRAFEGVSGSTVIEAREQLIDYLKLPAEVGSELRWNWSSSLELLRECSRLGVRVDAFGFGEYPRRLHRLPDPPAFLFRQGDPAPPTFSVAVVGTRKPTSWGEKTAEACVHKLAALGATVISGLALGVDTVAHRTALEAGAETWAVLAHGLDSVYPAANRELASRITAAGGALVSEYAPHTRPNRGAFIQRDRIQAGLADAVLVIETGPRGGSMHTVRFAREAGVPVWATFPHGKADAKDETLPEVQRGTLELLRCGAEHVTCAKDLVRLAQSSAASRRGSGQLSLE